MSSMNKDRTLLTFLSTTKCREPEVYNSAVTFGNAKHDARSVCVNGS